MRSVEDFFLLFSSEDQIAATATAKWDSPPALPCERKKLVRMLLRGLGGWRYHAQNRGHFFFTEYQPPPKKKRKKKTTFFRTSPFCLLARAIHFFFPFKHLCCLELLVLIRYTNCFKTTSLYSSPRARCLHAAPSPPGICTSPPTTFFFPLTDCRLCPMLTQHRLRPRRRTVRSLTHARIRRDLRLSRRVKNTCISPVVDDKADGVKKATLSAVI